MTIAELYENLCRKDFRDPATGSLFFPVYMYLYKAEQEYEIRNEIADLSARLKRPAEFIDAMVVDVFDEFINFLKYESFGDQNLLETYISEEKNNNPNIGELVRNKANSDVFMQYLNNLIIEYLQLPSQLEKVYVFMHGFGKMFPWLRVNRFLNRFERYIQGYKMVIFYPGEAKDHFSLFGKLKDEHAYRTVKLINDQTFNV